MGNHGTQVACAETRRSELYIYLSKLKLIDPPNHTYTSPNAQQQCLLRRFRGAFHGQPDDAILGAFNLGMAGNKYQWQQVVKVANQRIGRARERLQWLMRNGDAVILGCVGFEEAWLADAKQVLRSVVGASLEVAKLGKILEEHGEEAFRSKGWVRVPEARERAHPWWVVPEIGFD